MFNYHNPYLQQNQNQFPTTTLIFVNGIEEVKKYIIPLNSTMYFKDSDSDRLYIKYCDNMGKIYLKSYKILEILENEENNIEKQEDFVKISDFKALQEDFNNLKALITKTNENKGDEQ